MRDPYTSDHMGVDRLLADHYKYKKLIVAVDFDDTVFDYHQQGHYYDWVFSLLRRCKKLGYYVTVFTASPVDRHLFIEEHMLSEGIKIDSINRNPIPLPYGNNGKIFYNILLDDRAGLGQACQILDEVLSRIESEELTQ